MMTPVSHQATTGMADVLMPSSENSDKDLLDLVNDTDSESSDSDDSHSEDAVQQNLTGGDEGDNAWIFDRNNPQYLQVEKNMQISELRKSQAQVLSLLYKEKSVLLLARTGWGKSLIFQGLFHMQLEIGKSARFITIIFVPLSGLGQEQVAEINKRSRELGATEDTAFFYDQTKVGDHHLEDIQRGKYKWVYMSPEKGLHPDVRKSLWENVDFRSKVLLLAVDEAHLVSEWYVT
jgi:superfamily II DNA helicase RecQ